MAKNELLLTKDSGLNRSRESARLVYKALKQYPKADRGQIASRVLCRAWVLENAALRNITVIELLRNLVEADMKIDANYDCHPYDEDFI